MTIDPGLALGAIFTTAGAVPWSYAVQGIIQVLKMVPQFEKALTGYEKLLSFVLAGVFVGLAFAAGLQAVPPERNLDIAGLVVALFAWFGVARLTMAAYDDLFKKVTKTRAAPKAGERPSESILSAKGWTGK